MAVDERHSLYTSRVRATVQKRKELRHEVRRIYETNAAAAGYVAPYTYAALPGAAGLPAAAAAAATAAGTAFPGLPYQTTPQEARLQ
ncbi:hypothetical protein HN011_006674 [Eciton burchellii]|nr:hypothetical protein HN011_006674 [Eciton burchellii]